MSSLVIRNFGGLRVFEKQREIPLAPDFPRAAFSYLASRPGKIICRSTLADILWTELDAERARKAMNTALWRMRQVGAVRAHLVAHSRTTIMLAPGRRGWIDTDAFETRVRKAAALESAEPHRARKLVGRALEIYRSDPFSDVGDDWAVEERARLENLFCDALFLHARLCFDSGEYVRCVESCGRLGRLEPFREDVKAMHVEALVRSGNRAQAMHIYGTFRDLLASELGVAPEFPPPVGSAGAGGSCRGPDYLDVVPRIRSARQALCDIEDQLVALARGRRGV